MEKWLISRQKVAEVSGNTEQSPDNDVSSSTSTRTQEKRKLDNKESSLKKRKYDDSYIQFGFTSSGDPDSPFPQCVVCAETLSNHSLKPSLLRRHLETKHGNLKDQSVSFFQHKLKDLKQRQKSIEALSQNTNNNALQASFRVSYLIAKQAKPHTIGENLILPAAKEIVKCMFGEKMARELDVIPMSNNTVSRRIADMSENLKTHQIKRILESDYFAIQLDESTDITNLAQLLTYVRYVHSKKFYEEFLFCRTLSIRTTGEDIFHMVDSFVKENQLDWSKCVGICTDGARAMTGRFSGLVKRIQDKAPEAKWTHCGIHREALACKKIPASLDITLKNAVKIVNLIKARATNSRIFTAICKELGSEHETLLLHTEVRWLSRGRVVSRVFELRHEIELFLVEQGHDEYKQMLTDSLWVQRLAYLSDIFTKLNELNLGLQGRDTTIFTMQEKVESTIKKISLWTSLIDNCKYDQFPNLKLFLDTTSSTVNEDLKSDIKCHLQNLSAALRNYFPEISPQWNWVNNPFANHSVDHLPISDQEELIDISCNSRLKSCFAEQSLGDFWANLQDIYHISEPAIKYLLPFSTTYLCESGFSAMSNLKTKHRHRLQLEDDLRLKLTEGQPDFQELCKEKRAHLSH